MIGRVASALALIWLVGGCAALAPTAPTATPPTTAAPSRLYHESIELAGRLSVQFQRDSRDEAVHGSFTWSQTPDRTLVTLLSPLGQTIAIIDVTPGRATLTQAGQAARTAADADALAASTLGWPLPIAGLRDWLQAIAIDAQGRRWSAPPQPGAEVTTQDGWRIVYASWRDDAPAASLPPPRRIDLSRQTAQAGNVAIRLIVDSWQPK